jgi:ParB family chromosome partitioning protein
MRLLELPKEVKKYVSKGQLSAGHAKSLLGLQMAKEQILVAKQAISSGMSVRQLEKLVAKLTRPARKPRAMKDDVPKSHVAYLNDVLQRHLGTPVRITPSKTLANGKKAKGSIEIDIFSPDDLDRVLELLGISLDGD